MKIDIFAINRKSVHVWWIVLLASLIVMIRLLIDYLLTNSFVLHPSIFLMTIAFALLSTISVLISGLDYKNKHYIGFGLPLILSLPIPLFLHMAKTCSGKFCEIIPLLLVALSGAIATIFLVFYIIGLCAVRWGLKFIIPIIIIESILLIVLFYFFTTIVF